MALVNLLIGLPQELIAQLGVMAHKSYMNRSAYIRKVLAEHAEGLAIKPAKESSTKKPSKTKPAKASKKTVVKQKPVKPQENSVPKRDINEALLDRE